MKKSLSVFSFALVTVVSITACDNDDDGPKSRTDFLTQSNWSLAKVEVQLTGESKKDDITDEFQEDCEKDNTIKFSRDLKYNEAIGSDDCDGNEEAEKGTWAWLENESRLAITIDGDTQEQEIISLDDNTMKTKSDVLEFDLDGDNVPDTEGRVYFTLTAKR